MQAWSDPNHELLGGRARPASRVLREDAQKQLVIQRQQEHHPDDEHREPVHDVVGAPNGATYRFLTFRPSAVRWETVGLRPARVTAANGPLGTSPCLRALRFPVHTETAVNTDSRRRS
jgi:hypothetical protein